jgi:uncharacterized protein YcfJ
MRKTLATFVLLAMMVIGLPLAAEAHAGCRAHRRSTARTRSYAPRRYASQRYYAPAQYSQGYYTERQRPSFYRRHRNVINIAAGTGAGALIGALVGGKRGAAIGALAGAGGSALYTYKIRPKRRRY